MIIKRSSAFNHLFTIIVLLPVIFSFMFKIVGLPIPSYLFVSILSALLLVFTSNGGIIASKSWFRLFFYLFFVWILGSIVYTPSIIASKEKCINILYNTILPVIIIQLFFVFSKKKNIDFKVLQPVILKYAFILIWFSFFAYIFFGQVGENGRYTLPGIENAIWFSRFIGMLFIIILCCGKISIENVRVYSLTILIALFLLFGGGSRGPFIAVLITFFVKQSYFISKSKLIVLLSVVGVFIAIGFSFIGGYLFETNFYSLYARQSLFNALTEYNFQYFTGTGVGSYALSLFGDDVVYYPHNIFMELFFENGLVGVFLFCVLLFLFFKSFKPNVVNLLSLYYLIASLVSGDIPGNNNLFILLFLSSYAIENRKYVLGTNSIVIKNDVILNESHAN